MIVSFEGVVSLNNLPPDKQLEQEYGSKNELQRPLNYWKNLVGNDQVHDLWNVPIIRKSLAPAMLSTSTVTIVLILPMRLFSSV